MDTIQGPARRCLVASGKILLKGETWCESGAKVQWQKLTPLRGHSESSHVCFVCHQPWVSSSALVGHLREWVPVDWHMFLQRRPAHAKLDFNGLSGPRNGTWKRRCGISCLRSLAPMRRLQCSTTHATFTNPSLLRATPLLRGMF